MNQKQATITILTTSLVERERERKKNNYTPKNIINNYLHLTGLYYHKYKVMYAKQHLHEKDCCAVD